MEPLDKATAVLNEQWQVIPNGNSITVLAERSDTPAIIQQLVANNIAIYQAKSERQSLEQFFLDVTGKADS